MGIKNLMNLLKEKAPGCIKQLDLKTYTGRTVACDASMAIYQFLISTQHINKIHGIMELKDVNGNLTGHLLGLFNRSIMLLENGIKPCWVFDGKPPDAKLKLLGERKQKKLEAEENKNKALEENDMQKVLKYANQSVKITSNMIDDAKKLVSLLGLPVIESPSEAEAQCSILAKSGKVYASVTEDMDSLTFGCPILLRGFSNKDEPVMEIRLDIALKELDITMEEFIDICILCGCDYCDSIDGIGPTKAYKYIKEYKDIEGVIKFTEKYNLDSTKKKKYICPNEDFDFDEARRLFKTPNVIEAETIELKWNNPDFDSLKEFLCKEKGFSETRLDSAFKRIESAKSKTNQQRLDNFFQLKSTTVSGKKKAESISTNVSNKKGKKK